MKRFMKSVFPLMGVLLYVAVASCSDDGEIGKPLFEMSMNKSTLALEVGKSETLVVSYNPSDTPNQGHTWGSSNPEIATVDESGKVTAEAIGECTVTARSLTGNVTTTCNVKVVDKIIRVTSVSLDKTTAELATGETLALEATILPSNATNKGVKWTSSSNEVAIVNAEGVVSAVAEGETTITVTTDDNSKKATCKLTVVPEGVKFSEPTIKNITSNSALIVGSIEPRGVTITEAGFCIATTSTPTVDNGKVMLLQGGGTISTVLKELNAETTYYLRFYAIADGKVRYGNQTVFETLPAVTLDELITHIEPYAYNRMVINGSYVQQILFHVSAPKGYKEINICYGTNPEPKITDNIETITLSEEGTSYLVLSNINQTKTYYIRSYSIIGSKVEYSDEIVKVLPVYFSESCMIPSGDLQEGQILLCGLQGTKHTYKNLPDGLYKVSCHGETKHLSTDGINYSKEIYIEGPSGVFYHNYSNFGEIGIRSLESNTQLYINCYIHH